MIFKSPGAIFFELNIPWYGIAIGLIVILIVGLRMVRQWDLKRGSSEWWIVNTLLFTFIICVVGRRVKDVLATWNIYASNPIEALTAWTIPITVRWYGVMIALGFVAATYMAIRLAKRWELDEEQIVNGALISFMGGVLGARLYFVAISWDYFSHHPAEILATWLGGMSIHGGIIGGFLVAAIYCRYAKLPVLRCFDLGGTVIPLAQAIGRWGNFFNSEAFGKPVGNDFPLKLFIPKESRPYFPLSNYEYFHPTFLYECLWNLMIFCLLYFFISKKLAKYPGSTFAAYIALYSIGRLLIEPIRVDSIMAGSTPIPIIASAVSLVASVACLIGLRSFYKRKAQPQEAGKETASAEQDQTGNIKS